MGFQIHVENMYFQFMKLVALWYIYLFLSGQSPKVSML